MFDQWCSGRRRCEVRVSSIIDAIPDGRLPCTKDLRNYMEARFSCVKVVSPQAEDCITSPYARAPASAGYLASVTTESTGCGSLESPWLVTAKPGQTIKLTLLDFALSTRDRNDYIRGIPNVCHVYAIIKDRQSRRTETVCGGIRRETMIYTSSGNSVEIRIVRNKSNDKTGYFALRYEPVGCPHLPAPSGGWMQRLENVAVFGCNGTSQTWRLKCDGSEWRGEKHNCSKALAAGKSQGRGMGAMSSSQWASILIIISIALTLGMVIFLVGLMYLRRRRANQDHRRSSLRYSVPDYYTAQHPEQVDYTHKPPSNLDSYTSSENDYYRTWQLQRHGPGGARVVAVPPPHVPYDSVDRTTCMSEHIYESPKFDRREPTISRSGAGSRSDPLALQYYELDPQSIQSDPLAQ
ncbi:hypothetical protein NP493_151g04008 [Ridgeia piscesae]|uniref:CUB domain-containing protein n=1 Tax=Ridgeia piscesae TaxID=27915 RepID=A0AAD9P4A2_RIDPI|nr:hypothetical protein NP493_151g04008 [Ridgeia piscesae]